MTPEEKQDLRDTIMNADATEEEYKEIAGWVVEAGNSLQTTRAFKRYIQIVNDREKNRNVLSRYYSQKRKK